MSNTAKPAAPDANDPSMEDILASIRRILNEDEAQPAPKPDQPPAEEEVLVLDPSMMVSIAKPTVDDVKEDHPQAPEPDPVASASEPEPAHLPPVIADPEPGEIIPQDADDQEEAPQDRTHHDMPHQSFDSMTPASPTIPTTQASPSPDLLAPEAAAAAASSVDSLLRTLSAGRPVQVHTGGPTLEDMVRAELRPLLKEWLNVNLPPVVERLVRAEIEKVVGRSVPS